MKIHLCIWPTVQQQQKSQLFNSNLLIITTDWCQFPCIMAVEKHTMIQLVHLHSYVMYASGIPFSHTLSHKLVFTHFAFLSCSTGTAHTHINSQQCSPRKQLQALHIKRPQGLNIKQPHALHIKKNTAFPAHIMTTCLAHEKTCMPCTSNSIKWPYTLHIKNTHALHIKNSIKWPEALNMKQPRTPT